MRLVLRVLLMVLVLSPMACANKHKRSDPALGISRGPTGGSEIGGPNDGQSRPLISTRQPWKFAESSGHLITTPNYRIYTTIESERILDRIPLFCERALEHYTTALARLPKPQMPLETFLFQTRSQWQDKTTEMLPDQARMFSNLGRGGFTTRGISVLYYIDRFGYTRDTFAIAAHEGWHQYTQQTFKHQLPIWLEEGVATYMEGFRTNRDGVPEFMPAANYERREALRDAVRKNRMIPLYDILTRTPQSFLSSSKDSLLTYYSQVWALTRFLAEGENGRYQEALESVLIDAAEGRMVSRIMTSHSAGSRRGVSNNRVGPAVVQEYFNHDLGEFERQFLLFVDQLVQPRDGGAR